MAGRSIIITDPQNPPSHLRRGAYRFETIKKCATMGCPYFFVNDNPAALYCSTACTRKTEREYRREYMRNYHRREG